MIAPDNTNYDKLFLFSEKEITGLYNKLNIYNTQSRNSLGHTNTLPELMKNKKNYFIFNSLTYPELSKCVGSTVIQDLKESASIKPSHQKLNIILDEFNVFVSGSVINLINKSRAFNCHCFLSFQTVNDLNIKNTNLTDGIFRNVTSIIRHNLKDPNTTE
jgi:hypothetical protein